MLTEFTPIQSLLGGALIGLSAVALMALHGRIAGATGILTGILFAADGADRLWRVAMVAGMVCAPMLYWALFGAPVEIAVPSETPLLIVGGVLVGIGVTFGSGCTSGHGVCGLARFSLRSLVAVLSFMAATGVTVFLLRHVF